MVAGWLDVGVTPAQLIGATVVFTTAVVLDRYPEFTSDLLAHLMSSDASHTGHDMGRMRGAGRPSSPYYWAY